MSSMDTILPIAIDALGGDNAPEAVVEGALQSDVPVILVGPEKILRVIAGRSGSSKKVTYVNAEDKVEMDEPPKTATKRKDSSMMTGIRLVADGVAAGVMSAGNTGAFMMGAWMALGRLTNISRPAVAIPVPTPSGQSLLLDAGASTDSRPTDLVNFAVMGMTYVRLIWGVANPRVALLSIGEEETKGSKDAKEAHKLLRASGLNFVGNVQGSDLGTSAADVIVTDGFTGNVALKAAEGVSSLVIGVVKDELSRTKGLSRLAALILRPYFETVRRRLDWQMYGGGALLGVRGNVVIAHGKSSTLAIASAIRMAYDLAKTDLVRQLEQALSEHHARLAADAGANTAEAPGG